MLAKKANKSLATKNVYFFASYTAIFKSLGTKHANRIIHLKEKPKAWRELNGSHVLKSFIRERANSKDMRLRYHLSLNLPLK